MDNSQNQGSSSFLDDDEADDQATPKEFSISTLIRMLSGKLLGLKPQQLFILLLMLLVVVSLLGTMFLLVTGRMVVPNL